MSEKILKIEEIENYVKNKLADKWREPKYDGYKITTTNQEIFILIENCQSCCENWGYITSEDEAYFNNYIGSELLRVELTDTELRNYELDTSWGGDAMFVDLVTSEGVLQFVLYNLHNGYYGHEVLVISEQLNHSEIL